VVEKPIALSGSEALELAAAASRARVHGMTAFTYRGFTSLRRARTLIHEVSVGGVQMVAGHFLQDWLTRPSANWRLDPAKGGPSLTVADIGVHWFDAVEYVSAHRVVQVIASLAMNRPQARWGEDTAAVLLKFENDALGTVLLSQAFSGKSNEIRIEVAGALSSLTWELGPDGAELRGESVAPQDVACAEDAVDALANLFAPFYRAVLLREPPLVRGDLDYPTLWDGYRAAQFVDAVLESSRTHAWASVDTPG
jgi:predicted dehydrogenase